MVGLHLSPEEVSQSIKDDFDKSSNLDKLY